MPGVSGEQSHKRPESVLVLVCTRAGEILLLERSRPRGFWQSVTGSLEWGETAADAAARELFEETGMETVSLLAEAPDWIDYDLPDHLVGVSLKGKYRGQTQKWYAFRFDGSDSEIRINPPPGGHEPEFDAWAWKPLSDLPGMVVPFKRGVYDAVIAAFRHLAA